VRTTRKPKVIDKLPYMFTGRGKKKKENHRMENNRQKNLNVKRQLYIKKNIL